MKEISRKKIREIVLASVMFSYVDIATKEDKTVSVEVKNIFKRLKKKESQLRRNVKLNKSDSLIAENYFSKLKDIDATEFEDKVFSPTVMVFLILDVLIREYKSIWFYNEFMDINIAKLIDELENLNIRKTVFEHHRVVTKMLEI